MNDGSDSIRLERLIDVPPEVAWRTFTTSVGLIEWLVMDARADARPGGRLYLWFGPEYTVIGQYAALEPCRSAVLTLQACGDPSPTRVDVTLEPQRGGTATRIHIVHSGIGSDERWSEPRERIRQVWADGLENLVSVLEEGIDLRVFGRPMLGLSGGVEVTPEVAEQRRLAVDHGLMVTDFIEGMGAQAAGLERGDVIVRFGNFDVDGWQPLVAALAAQQVGDTVDVEFLRGPEVHHTSVTLAGRPRPRVPDSPETTAHILRQLQAQLRGEIRATLAGADAEQLARRPLPGEWSALECLAHLLTTERGIHIWLALRIQGEHFAYWASEEDTLLRATLAIWPTGEALLRALEQEHEHTATMIEHLSESFLERRASFVDLCDLIFSHMPLHGAAHVAQMAETIATVGSPSPVE